MGGAGGKALGREGSQVDGYGGGVTQPKKKKASWEASWRRWAGAPGGGKGASGG